MRRKRILQSAEPVRRSLWPRFARPSPLNGKTSLGGLLIPPTCSRQMRETNNRSTPQITPSFIIGGTRTGSSRPASSKTRSRIYHHHELRKLEPRQLRHLPVGLRRHLRLQHIWLPDPTQRQRHVP